MHLPNRRETLLKSNQQESVMKRGQLLGKMERCAHSLCGYLPCAGEDNKEEPVHSNQDHREGGEEDTGGLRGRHQLAKHLLKHYT